MPCMHAFQHRSYTVHDHYRPNTCHAYMVSSTGHTLCVTITGPAHAMHACFPAQAYIEHDHYRTIACHVRMLFSTGPTLWVTTTGPIHAMYACFPVQALHCVCPYKTNRPMHTYFPAQALYGCVGPVLVTCITCPARTLHMQLTICSTHSSTIVKKCSLANLVSMSERSDFVNIYET